MKFTAQASALLPALRLAQARAKSGSTIPILSHVLLTVDGNKLTITGNDLDASTQAFAMVGGAAVGSCAVPAEILVRLVSSLPSEAHISIEIEGRQQISLKAGRSRYKLPILPASDFPQPFTCEGSFSVDLSAADIIQLFSRPAAAIHKDEKRAILRGCYLHAIDGKLSSVATDGVHLLALTTEHRTSFGGAVVPLWAAAEIEKVGKGGGKLTIADTTLAFEAAEARYYSKLVDGKYPYYQNAVPALPADYVTIDRAEALAVAKRLAILAKDEADINLSFGDGEIVASIDGLGAGAETIACSGASSAYLAFAPDRLVGMLSLPKGETIQLHLIDCGTVRIVDPFEPSAIIVEATRRPKRQKIAA